MALAQTILTLLLAGSLPHYPGPGSPPPCSRDSAWVQLVRSQLARYPAMQPADAYKLLHQATMGSEHAMPSRAMAEQWMTRERAQLLPGPGEPMVDTLGAGGAFVRINLRPFLAAGGSPDSLVNAFVRTAEVAARDTVQLGCALNAVRRMAQDHEVGWPADSVDRMYREAAVAGYPAMHHSAAYEATYHPAYRVVSVTLVAGTVP